MLKYAAFTALAVSGLLSLNAQALDVTVNNTTEETASFAFSYLDAVRSRDCRADRQGARAYGRGGQTTDVPLSASCDPAPHTVCRDVP